MAPFFTKAIKSNIVIKLFQLLLVFLISASSFELKAQCTTTANTQNWTTLTWSNCGETPSIEGSVNDGSFQVGGLGANETLTLNVSIIIDGSLSFTGQGNSNPAVFRIPAGKTLIIKGDLSINNKVKIFVEDGASLIVTGNINGGTNDVFEGDGYIQASQIQTQPGTSCGPTGCPSIVTWYCNVTGGGDFCSTNTTTPTCSGNMGYITGGGVTNCGSSSGTLTLNDYSGTITRWEKSVSPYSTWTPIVNTASTYSYGSITQTTRFRAVVTNGSCTRATASTTITYSSTSVNVVITNPAAVCSGSTVNLTASSVTTGSTSGLTYSYWTNSSATTSLSNPSAVATSGTYYIKGTHSNGCFEIEPVTVTINPATVAGSVSGGTSICSGSPSGQLILSGHTGTVQKWQYSTNNGSNWTDIAHTGTTYTSGNLTQTTLFRAVVKSGACAAQNSGSTTVTIKPLPTLTNVPTNRSECVGTNIAVTSMSSTGTISWTNSNTAIGLVASGNGQVPAFTTTNNTASDIVATITATATLNGCTSVSTYTITVKARPTLTGVPSNLSECVGTNIAVTSMSSTGTISWTNSHTAIGLAASGNGQVPAFTTTNNTASDIVATITATATLNGCTRVSTYTITVKARPTLTNVSASRNVCVGTNIAVTAMTSTGAISWTNSNTSIGLAASGNGQVPAFTATNNTSADLTGTITVTATLNGCTRVSSYTITVYAIPSAPVVNATYSCGPGNITLSASGSSKFNVYMSQNAVSPIQTNLQTYTGHFNTTTSYWVTAVNDGGCESSSRVQVTANVYPIPTVTVPSNYSVCNGATITPSFSSSVGSSTFTWTSSNPSITVPASGASWKIENLTNATASTTVTVTATTPNGCTGTNTFQITVNPTNTWNGNTSSDWHTASNWCGGVPTANQDVLIPSTAANFPQVNANAICRNLTINTPGSLTIEGATLTVEGTSQIDGSLIFDNAASRIVYNGASIYNGSWTDNAAGTVVYNSNVIFNKAVTSKTSITVNGNLTFPTNGKITMADGAVLSLGLAATYSGASRTSFVEGQMDKVLASTSTFVFPVGQDTLYRRVGITPQTATPTTYSAKYIKGNSNTEISSNKITNISDPLFLYKVSAVEYWLLEKNIPSAKARVSLYWGTSSAVSPNGDYFNELKVAHYNQVTDLWEGFAIQTLPANSVNMNSGSITSVDYLESFSPFTLGTITEQNPLPVQYKTFAISQETSGVQLDWVTASETTNAGFEVERSYDGFKTFETLAFVEGKGTTSETTSYSFLDTKASGKMVYYRLKQIDFDEKVNYSEIKYILLSRLPATTLIYPNPTTGIVVVTIEGIEAEKQVQYSIIGADGIVRVLGEKVSGEELNDHLSNDLGPLMNGAYTIMVTTAKSRHSIKVIKI